MFTDIGFDTISIIHPFASAAADSHIGSLNDYSFQSGLGGGLYTLLISYLNPAQILTYAGLPISMGKKSQHTILTVV